MNKLPVRLVCKKSDVKVRHNDCHSAQIRNFEFCSSILDRPHMNSRGPFTLELCPVQFELFSPGLEYVARGSCIRSRDPN